MKKYSKIIVISIYLVIVLIIIAIASGYTTLTNCDYFKSGSNILKPILGITLIGFLAGKALKMERDSIFILAVSASIFSLFTISHFSKKYKEKVLNEPNTIINEAIIYDISYHQFTTFLKLKTVPKKYKSSLALNKKSDLGNLKINDTILIKYSPECYGIMDFYNLSPTKEDLKNIPTKRNNMEN